MTYYGTVAEADTYLAARGITAWATAANAAKEIALTRGTSYVDTHYIYTYPDGRTVSRFGGVKTGGRAQENEWPRTDATDVNGDAIASSEIPREARYASYEAAAIELVTPGSLQPVFVASKLVKREKIGPLEREFAVSEDSCAEGSRPNSPTVPIIDSIIAPLLVAPSSIGYYGAPVYVV